MFNSNKKVNQIITLHSDDRTSGSINNASFKLNKQFFNVKKIRLLYFSIMHTFYNVTQSSNTLTFDEGSGPIQITLTPGTYSINLLLDTIKTEMDSAGTQTYTVIFDPITHKVNFSSSNNFSLMFATDTAMAQLLGFDTIDTTMNNSHTAQNIYNLARPDHIFVRLAELPANAYDSTGRSAQYVVPINVPFGDKVVFRVQNDYLNEMSLLQPINISKLEITLYDDSGSLLEINGTDQWIIILELVNDVVY